MHEKKILANRWYEEYNRVEIYKKKKIRKLRVVKKSWYESKLKYGEAVAIAMMKRKMSDNFYSIERKIQRIEGNDIVDLIIRELQEDKSDEIDSIINKALGQDRALTDDEIEEINELSHNQTKSMKEIHVTGRMAKKLWASDKILDTGHGFTNNVVSSIHGIPVIRNNDSFPDDTSDNPLPRNNPTGRDEWLKEIKFIEE